MVRILFILCYFIIHYGHAESAHKLTTLYGWEQAGRLKETDAEPRFKIQAGAFQQEENAKQCKKTIEAKTGASVEIIPPKPGSRIYLVMVGPVDAKTAKTVSQLFLTGKKASALPAVAIMPKNTGRPSTMPKKASPEEPSSHLPSVAAILTERHILLDAEAKQDLQISKMMSNDRKMHLTGAQRQSVESRVAALQSELSAIESEIKTESHSKRKTALLQQRTQVEQKLGHIMTLVMARITQKA